MRARLGENRSPIQSSSIEFLSFILDPKIPTRFPYPVFLMIVTFHSTYLHQHLSQIMNHYEVVWTNFQANDRFLELFQHRQQHFQVQLVTPVVESDVLIRPGAIHQVLSVLVVNSVSKVQSQHNPTEKSPTEGSLCPRTAHQ